uniref:Uncharacterized protein n=1 Tax=Panagrolaimus superbus TaxID=310955 RepID=A0A914YJN3_9BILA
MKLFLFFCFILGYLSRITVAEEIRDEGSEEVLSDYNYACGDELMETKCKCNETVLNCDSSGVKNLNIHIIAENFTVKSAKFNNDYIQILRKRKILPGREYSVQSLDFQHNWITEIENGTFDEFLKIETLILSNNRLTKIDENVLTETLGKTLTSLDFKENNFQQLSSKTFMYLKKLEFLGLSDNPGLVPYFNKNIFSASLKNLKHLDLSWCNISILEDDAFSNLRQVFL